MTKNNYKKSQIEGQEKRKAKKRSDDIELDTNNSMLAYYIF